MRPANLYDAGFWYEWWDAILEVLRTADHLRAPKYRGHPNIAKGHCYVASEAAYHLLGGKRSGWKPMFMYWMGQPHWFLQHKNGGILDLTAMQFAYIPRYKQAKGKGFLTKKPSKRAREMMELIEFELSENGVTL